MRTHVLHREQRLDGTPEEVFPFFADARNLEAITPPLLRFRVVTPGPIDVHAGTFLQYRLRAARRPGHVADDRSRSGTRPTASSTCRSAAPTRCGTTRTTFAPDRRRRDAHDATRCATPIGFGPLGELAHRALVRRDVEAIFAFRAQRVPALLRGVRSGPALAAAPTRRGRRR